MKWRHFSKRKPKLNEKYYIVGYTTNFIGRLTVVIFPIVKSKSTIF